MFVSGRGRMECQHRPATFAFQFRLHAMFCSRKVSCKVMWPTCSVYMHANNRNDHVHVGPAAAALAAGLANTVPSDEELQSLLQLDASTWATSIEAGFEWKVRRCSSEAHCRASHECMLWPQGDAAPPPQRRRAAASGKLRLLCRAPVSRG